MLLVHEITEFNIGDFCRMVKKYKIILAIRKGSDFKEKATFFLCKIAKGIPAKRIIRWKTKSLLTLPK